MRLIALGLLGVPFPMVVVPSVMAIPGLVGGAGLIGGGGGSGGLGSGGLLGIPLDLPLPSSVIPELSYPLVSPHTWNRLVHNTLITTSAL